MLSRAAVPTEGDAMICGESVLSNAPEALRNLGLVPQDMNTLWGSASVDAHLRLFANLRPCHSNTNQESEEFTIVSILESMDLSAHRHKFAAALSGGMKRRLSTAVGLIGSPKVCVLDEPTAGYSILVLIFQFSLHSTKYICCINVTVAYVPPTIFVPYCLQSRSFKPPSCMEGSTPSYDQ